MQEFFCLSIRGDEGSPIMMGKLGGKVIPDKTTWFITKVFREKPGQKRGGMRESMPGLEIKLVKAKRENWPELIVENEVMVQRGIDAAPKIEELQTMALQREPSPDRSNWEPKDHAAENKAKADKAFKKQDFRDAAVYYTRALDHTPDDEKLLSNRAAACMKIKKPEKALADARKCISLNPKW